MEIAGYMAVILIGVSMGLIGGGGSILTIPILVYLFSIAPTLAVSYSLFIVGFTSLAGAIQSIGRRLVNFKIAMLFGSTSVITVFATRKFIIPQLPEVFFTIGSFKVTHALFVMVLFAILMLTASLSMIRTKKFTAENAGANNNQLQLLLYGVFIGAVTGLLGAGGGFLLIPALVLLMGLPMKEAIGTSLLIIALNSLVGFVGDIGSYETNWQFLIVITGIAIGGIFIGSYLNEKVKAEKLKKGFGWFVFIMGIYILVKEIFL